MKKAHALLLGPIALFLVLLALVFLAVKWAEPDGALGNAAEVPPPAGSASTTPPAATSTPMGVVPATPPYTGMKLVFDDEFDTLSRYVDANGNVTCKPGGTGTWQTVFAFCSRTIASNYEQELYIDPAFITYLKRTVPTLTTVLPFSISNGILSIIASSSEPAILKAAGSWAKYTSGLLTSQYSFSQRYGYFEIRAKLPTGRGVWPAFWLLPTDKTWPPEIDILEAFGDTSSEGQGGRSDIHYAIHSQDKKYSCEGWYDTKTDVTAGFHTYGADVEPDGVTYYFDGAPYAHCPPDTEPHKPMYLLLNLAIGSAQSWPTAPDSSTVFPTSFLIDYVRAYQSSAR